MFLSIARGSFIAYCSLFLYRKLMCLSRSNKTSVIFDICVSLLSGWLMCMLESYLPIFRIAGIVILIVCYIRFGYKQPMNTAVVVTVISLGFSLLFFILAGILESIALTIISAVTSTELSYLVRRPIPRIIAGAIQLLLACIPFRFDRLKNGMPFLQSVTFDEPCLLVGVLLVASTMLIRTENDTSYLVGAVPFGASDSYRPTYCGRKKKKPPRWNRNGGSWRPKRTRRSTPPPRSDIGQDASPPPYRAWAITLI